MEKRIYIIDFTTYYRDKGKASYEVALFNRTAMAAASTMNAAKKELKEIAEAEEWLWRTGGDLVTDLDMTMIDDEYPTVKLFGWTKDKSESRKYVWTIRDIEYLEEE